MREHLKAPLVALESMPKPRPAPVIHRKKLFGGRMTAEEVHAKHAFPRGAFCAGCKSTHNLQTRVMILMPLKDYLARDPELAAVFQAAYLNARAGDHRLIEKLNAGLVQTKHGPHMRISTTYACKACAPALEKEAAKAPSWCIVDIHRGVGADKAVSGYGGL